MANYIPEDAPVNLDAPPANADSDLTPSQLGERIRNLACAAAALLPAKSHATSWKQRAENNDLINRPPPGKSASTVYRERNGKTKKGRAKTMQRSLAPKPTEADNQDSSSDIEVYNS
ncbi:hypothetical protein B0H14DRAFT_2628899 [Mycena olivaceomarginata]|nr:hypothetical protein B0H14DRAFT_2628899 [Mycena olivaceomarginata]